MVISMLTKEDLTIFIGKMYEEYQNDDIPGFNMEITFMDWIFDAEEDDKKILAPDTIELYLVPKDKREKLEKNESISEIKLLDSCIWIIKNNDEANMLLPYSQILFVKEI